jgi:threonylcarbamoyladenosine tRNA methylthiotransferase MtaB
MKTYKVRSLGCRTNQYEEQAFIHQLKSKGLKEAAPGEEADLCIVNTCTVTESADASSRHQIRELLKQNTQARMLVTGCMAERLGPELLQIDPRIELVPNGEKEQLLSRVFQDDLPEFKIDAFENHTRAFVKVQDGCNSFCTYCIIPYVRGRSRSRPIQEILQEVEGIIASGYKEIVLTGINIGDFDGGGTLAELVCAVDAVAGLKRLRISSIDPDEVDEPLIAAILSGKNTCPNLHIVLQSGSNTILKRMNRKYTTQIFLKTIEHLTAASPDFTFTTDLIVGFPGESDADFRESLAIIQHVQFAKVHMFPYSARPRTRAALYPNPVSASVIQERKSEVLRLSEQVAFSLRERYRGRTMEVLVEQDGWGHTPNFLRVKTNGEPNTLQSVTLTHNTPEGLLGQN